jgi:hypothetical protein
MRPVLACITVGVLAAALTTAAPAGADPSDPTFAPNPVVLTPDSTSDPVPVSGTVQLEEPDGLTLDSAQVFDPSCELTWDSLPVDENCPAWLTMPAGDTSLVGGVRTINLSGAIPLEDDSGAPVDRPTTYVTVVYSDGTHEYLETGLEIYDGYRVSLEGPDLVESGAQLVLTSKAETYTSGTWVPDSGLQAELQHLSSGGAWEAQDTQTTDPNGDVTFDPQPLTESGDWRVALTEAGPGDPPLLRYSPVKHVTLQPAPPPPTPPVLTPAPAPAPAPPAVTPPRPAPVPATTRPSAPTRQHATAASGRATLFWAPPVRTGGARIDRYQIRRGTSSYVRNLAPTARRFTFTRLRNGSLYRLYVRAHNVKGFSGWVAASARPPVPPRHYASCASLHRVYPHGVGRPGARDRGSHVTTFTRSLATYRLNVRFDRDRDGISCERR